VRSSPSTSAVCHITGALSLHLAASRYWIWLGDGRTMIPSVSSAPPAAGSATTRSTFCGRPRATGTVAGARSSNTSCGALARLSTPSAEHPESASRIGRARTGNRSINTP
jgi:hypothetical protein